MQTIHFQYKDDDSTYLLNNQLTGILVSGVYRGYNLASVRERTLQLKGEAYEISMEGVEENTVSVLRTPQGCVVKETGIIDITLLENATESPRVDLIYCEHRYTSVEGGTEAVYKVRSGTIENIPEITDKKYQVPIALVTVPAGWKGGMDSLVYARFKTPDFAEDKSTVHTDRENYFTEEQTFKGTKKKMSKCEIVTNKLKSDMKGYDLYMVGSEEDSGLKGIYEIDLGSSAGKMIQLLIWTPCYFVNSGPIYTPYNVEYYYVNKGDLVTILDVTDGPIEGKKWIILANQSLKKDDNGTYIIDSGLKVNDIEGGKRLFNGMRALKLSVKNASSYINIQAQKYDLIEIEDDKGMNTNMGLLTDSGEISPGKEIIVINRGNYEVNFISAGFDSEADYPNVGNPAKTITVKAKTVVTLVTMSINNLFVKVAECSLTDI